MKRKIQWFLVMVVLMAMVVSCATFRQNTYKTLFIAGTTHDVAMKSVADLQAKGKITQAQRVEINKYANIFYGSYQVGVEAFLFYEQTKDTDCQG